MSMRADFACSANPRRQQAAADHRRAAVATDVAGDLETLLRPSSVAIVGASEDPFTYSGASVGNLLKTGFEGKIFPISLSRETVQGVPAFRSILDVGEAIDTAILAVPTTAVLPVLAECVEKGIGTVTIVSSGFGEDAAGPEGAERARELAAFIERTGVRVLGPNTAGLANLLDGYVPRAANNGLDPARTRAGGIALLTQSGAMGNTVFNRAQAHGVGIGLTVATGGQIDVDVWELAMFALADPRIRVVALIVETLDPASVERVAASAASHDKVVVLLRLGRSEAGRRAVLTHSGSLAGDDAVQRAALRQLSVIEVDELDDLWQVASLVDHWGPACEPVTSLGVVALSGGEGALIADCCAAVDVPLGETTAAFAEIIDANFDYATASNPFDPSGEVIGRPEKVKIALRGFVEANAFSDVLIASPTLRPEIARRQYADLSEIVAEPRPRIALSYWAAGDLTDTQAELLRGTGLPVFSSSRAAVRSLAFYTSVIGRGSTVSADEDKPEPSVALPRDAAYFDVRAELARAGVAFADAALVHTEAEAAAAASRIGFPVVMKANVMSSVHKFDNGLLAIGVDTAEEAADAFGRLAAAGVGFAADGVVVEALVRGGLEVMIGAHRDPEFGAVIMIGSGGSMVEYLQDSMLLVSRYRAGDDAEALVRGTRVGAYIAERSPAIAARLADIVELVAAWFDRAPHLEGLDLNPLMIELGRDRVVCVDARIA
jgi:acetate---CoA ligase (ADP-forming)